MPFLFTTIFHILPSLPFFIVPTLNFVADSLGPFLNDFFFPEMIWIFSTFLSLIGSVGFLKFHFLKKVQDH